MFKLKIINLWRCDQDFYDRDFYKFELFENVIKLHEIDSSIERTFSHFQISYLLKNHLSELIYDYCFGKFINLKNDNRWRKNFLSDINLYLLDYARYLQAYFRDVNKDISKSDSEKITNEKLEKYGSSDFSKISEVATSQSSNTSASDKQMSEKSEGDTLTILNNQSTSTNYLASKNDEAYSKGSTQQDTSTDVSKNVGHSLDNKLSNSAKIGVVDEDVVNNKTGVNSPLTIATNESNFNFILFTDNLKILLDSHFLVGGCDYA